MFIFAAALLPFVPYAGNPAVLSWAGLMVWLAFRKARRDTHIRAWLKVHLSWFDFCCRYESSSENHHSDE